MPIPPGYSGLLVCSGILGRGCLRSDLLGDLPAHDTALAASRRPSPPPPPPAAPAGASVAHGTCVRPQPLRLPASRLRARVNRCSAPCQPPRPDVPRLAPRHLGLLGAPPGPVPSPTSVPVVVPATLCRTAADSLPPAPYGYFRMVDHHHTTWSTCGHEFGPSLRSSTLASPTRTRMRATLLLFHHWAQPRLGAGAANLGHVWTAQSSVYPRHPPGTGAVTSAGASAGTGRPAATMLPPPGVPKPSSCVHPSNAARVNRCYCTVSTGPRQHPGGRPRPRRAIAPDSATNTHRHLVAAPP
jgi:hypothetical protein